MVESAQPAQLFPASYGVDVSAFAYPERKRSAPVTLAGDTPVDDVFKEVAHSARAYRRRDPVDGSVVFKKLFAHFCHLYEPARTRVIQKRSVAAPAERIGVLVHHILEQQSFFLQKHHYGAVAVLAEHAVEFFVRALYESAALVHHLQERKIVLPAHVRVVLAECGGDMHHARAVGKRHIVVAGDVKRLLLAVVAVEKRFVTSVFVFFARLYGQYFVFFKVRRHKRFCQHVHFAAASDFRVLFVGIHTQSHVGRKRPGRGRPREEVTFRTHAPEFGYAGALLDVLVSLRHFVRAERSSAAGAVRHYLEALVDKPLVEHGFEHPPHRFDIVVVVSDIGVVHIHPIAHALGHTLPFVLVFPHAFLALFDKRFHAVLFNILLAVHAQLFFHLQLHGQTVRVPAGFAQNVIPLHRLVTGDNILHDARENMPYVRLSVCRGRSVVKGKGRFSFVFLHAFFEYVAFFPELDHLLLSFAKMHIGRYFIVHLIPPWAFRPLLAVIAPR